MYKGALKYPYNPLKPFVVIFFCISFFSIVKADDLTISGVYHGQNLYIQNPSLGNKIYCTNEVFVNNRKVMSKITSSIYEINLSYLKLNDSVTVVITHQASCTPKVLNPDVLRPLPNFQFIASSVDQDVIKWTTNGERKTDTYQVQYKSNGTWLTLQTIVANNTGIYSTPIQHNAGLNTYRIKYSQLDGKVLYSKEMPFTIHFIARKAEPVTFYPRNVNDKIYFSRETPYEIRTTNGRVLRRGRGKLLTVNELTTGVYVLSFDNKKERFFKK